MDIDTVRQETAEAFGSIEEWAPDYITTELLSDYEEHAAEVAEDGSDGEEAGEEAKALGVEPTYIFYYGNRPAFVRDTSRVGYVGKLFFTNGSPNRPNDPCGQMYRRVVWCRRSPYGWPYRNCGAFWGFRFSTG